MSPDSESWSTSRAHRRSALAAAAALVALGLAGCGSSPPVQLYHLRADPPATAPPPPAAAEIWQLMLPVRVPDYLDREAILLPQGQTGLLALSGHRWAESLRDAVPRLLRQDLAAWRGEGRTWTAPLPPGVVAARQLRVELLALEADAERTGVRLLARWTLFDPLGRTAPGNGSATLRVAASGSSIDSLVAAHRQALWQLAQRIADTR